MHRKLRVLPWEVSYVPREVACNGNWLRGGAILSDRMGEVSRRHSRRSPNVGIETEPREEGRTHFAEGLNG